MSDHETQAEKPATDETKVETEGATITKTHTDGVAADGGEQVQRSKDD